MINRFNTLREEAARTGGEFVVEFIDRILAEAAARDASDVHFHPRQKEMEIRFRINGVLQSVGVLESGYSARIAARLKVLAHLLTYKTDVPQEGRVRAGIVPNVAREMRISTASTLYGERVVVRFFAEEMKYHFPEQLGFPGEVLESLLHHLRKNSGAIIISGPAGSGKTTTAYSLLRNLIRSEDRIRSIVSLEDPIEHALEQVAQIELNERNPHSLDEMIKYVLRQDPEVLFVGEIRDRNTAVASLQAALAGHLLISTFHAGNTIETLARLYEMGIEPFVLRSSITYILSQRLLRRLCPDCLEIRTAPLSLQIEDKRYDFSSYAVPCGCSRCGETGYSSRILLAEALPLESSSIFRGISQQNDLHTIRENAVREGLVPFSDRAATLLRDHLTSPQEIQLL